MKRQLFFMGIKGKFVLAAASIVAISSIVWGTWAWHNEKRLLNERLESNARSMTTALATPIINALLYEEMGVIEEGGLLDNFVEEIVANGDFPTLYAFVTDDHGKVLAHTRYMEYGLTYRDELTTTALQGDAFLSRVVRDERSREHILDVAMPLHIYGKVWGTLRVGLSMKPLERELTITALKVASFSLLFFLVGTTVFYLVGRTMTRPLQHLAGVMKNLDPAKLSAELPERRNDEIGQLQDSFQEMLDRLRTSEMERQQVFSSLVQSEKMATIGKLVAGVAHEINNPLTAISGSIYYLEQENSANVKTQTELLKRGLGRINGIVHQLRDFSRAATLELEPVDSNLFFEEAKTFAGMALKKKPVRFRGQDACIPPVAVVMDKGKMHQVVLNLVLNAADACGSTGDVRLSASSDGANYVLTVADTGEGIPEADLERIFEIFYTTKPAGEGTGMGLAICRNIVDMHHGAITVASRPGETVFTVTIPSTTEVPAK